MKPSSWLVPGVLVSLAALVSAPGCSGGSKTAEPTTLPSASRPPRPPTRVRTEQSREDPLEVDGRTERLGTLGGPLERRRLPSNDEPLDIPETDLPADRDGAAPAGARAPGAERADDDEEEIPDGLQRGGPDATSETRTGSAGDAGAGAAAGIKPDAGAGTGARGTQPGAATRNESTAGASTTGGFIPIDVPPSAGATKSSAANGSKAKGTTANGARRSAAQTSAGTSRGTAGTGSSAGREKAAGESDTRQGSSSRPTGGDDDTGAGSANAAEGGAGGQSQSGAGGASTGQGSGTGGGATGGTSGSGTGGAAGGGATGGAAGGAAGGAGR